MGMCQWLIVAGRFDLCYTVSSLLHFSNIPCERHLKLVKHLMGYICKHPNCGYVINPKSPKIDIEHQTVEVKQDFDYQYSYFWEELDPRFLEALLEEWDINFFVNTDHTHDKSIQRSVTGIMRFIGSMPIVWKLKWQACIMTSTFSAEFTALKRSVEEMVTMRYHLQLLRAKSCISIGTKATLSGSYDTSPITGLFPLFPNSFHLAHIM